jgi:3-dehydrosphinganine reductase
MKSFIDKQVLITGGSSGIGLALAKLLSGLGAHVCILARREDVLQQALIEIKSVRQNANQRFDAFAVDVSDPTLVNQVIRDIIRLHGAPDIVVNSAGVVQPGLFQDLTPEAFKWNMDINFFGTVNVIQAVVPEMIKRGSGIIANVSSMAGFLGTYGYTAYGASKYAVRGFSDALRAEMKPHGIHVHIVFPPDTDTPQLVYDNANKPFVTKELSGAARAMSAEAVSASIIKGITRREYIITPGFDASFYYFLSNLLGRLVYPVMDFMINRAIRKLRCAHHQRREQESTHPDKV